MSKIKFEDGDLMPFGKYSGTCMADVPASYLVWLGEELDKKSLLNPIEQMLKDYIDENQVVLETEIKRSQNGRKQKRVY